MSLKKRDYYLRDYYALKRLQEKDSLIDFLNSKGLENLINPFLYEIVENILIKIRSKDGEIGFSETNYSELDNIIKETLSLNGDFINIKESSISTRLFSNALEKLKHRLFDNDGLNDEKYILQSNIGEWIEDNLARVIVSDIRFKSYETTIKTMEFAELLHHFYTALKKKIPYEWIRDDLEKWVGVEENPHLFLSHFRSFDENYFASYDMQIKQYSDYSPWNYVKEATQFSDQMFFNYEYAFKNAVLVSKDVSAWIMFWDNLKLPILQDAAFHYIDNPKDILVITEQLSTQRQFLQSPYKYLVNILMKNFFKSVLAIESRLSFYEDENMKLNLSAFERDEEILSLGKIFYKEWKKEKLETYKSFMKRISQLVTPYELSQWVFSYEPHTKETRREKNYYNEEIELLVKKYGEIVSKLSYEEQLEYLEKDFSFQRFNFLVQNIPLKNRTSFITILLEKFLHFIKSEKFFWDQTFSPTYWPAMKNIGFLLSMTEAPTEKAKELTERFKVRHEGWNISTSDYENTRKESFIFCGAILLMEHKKAFKDKNDRISYFKFLLNSLLTQSRVSRNVTGDYKLPIYMLSLVVNQIYKDMKRAYEHELIRNLDSIKEIIEIFTSDEYVLHQSSKKLLAFRVNHEIPFVKRKFLQRGQINEKDNLEKNIAKLGLD